MGFINQQISLGVAPNPRACCANPEPEKPIKVWFFGAFRARMIWGAGVGVHDVYRAGEFHFQGLTSSSIGKYTKRSRCLHSFTIKIKFAPNETKQSQFDLGEQSCCMTIIYLNFCCHKFSHPIFLVLQSCWYPQWWSLIMCLLEATASDMDQTKMVDLFPSYNQTWQRKIPYEWVCW